MENMLKYDFMKHRHHLLYYRVAPIYIRYTLYTTKKDNKTYKFDHCTIDRIVAASRPLQIYTGSSNPIGADLAFCFLFLGGEEGLFFIFFSNIMCFVINFG